MSTDTLCLIVANTPGQVRGPKADLWPFPKRVHGAVREFRKAADGLPVVVTLAELSSRALQAWSEHKHWQLLRGTANTILPNLGVKVGNAIAARHLDVVDGDELRFRYAAGVRSIRMPIRLVVTPGGAPLVTIAVHVPTKRAASKAKRKAIVQALEAYALQCWRIGLPVVLAGDWNGAHIYLTDPKLRLGCKADVQRAYGIGVKFIGFGVIDSAGKFTDHKGGSPYVDVTVPVTELRDLPERAA